MIIYMIMAIAMGVFYMVMVRVSTDAGWWYMMLSVTVPPLIEWTKPFATYIVVKRLCMLGFHVHGR